MTTDEMFHEERRQGLGGSDLGAILGLNPWRTPFEVWQEKTGRSEPFAGNLQTRFGHYAEEFVAQEYTRKTGMAVRRHNAMLISGRGPIIGHVDRLVVPEGGRLAAVKGKILANRGLECKTAHAMAASRAEWGDNGTDEVPASYLLQCAVYMHLTGCERWDLAALFGNSDFRVYHLLRDSELEEMLVEEAARWWRDYVETDTPPPPSTEAEARQLWPRHKAGSAITINSDGEQLFRQYLEAKAEEKRIAATIKNIRDELMPMLADGEVVLSGSTGKQLASFKANRDSMKTDWKSVAIAAGASEEQIAAHTVITPGARVLRPTKEAE